MHEIQWTDKKVKRIWDYYATNEAYAEMYFSRQFGRFILEYLSAHLSLKDLQNILDFGCGPGYMIENLVNLTGNRQCYGLEFSKQSVALVNQKFLGHPKFVKAIAPQQLPCEFPSTSMDLIIAIEVIEHLNDMQIGEMFCEIRRLLKPSGYVVITTPHAEELKANKTICPECGCIFHRWQHMSSWTEEKLTTYLKKYALTPLHVAATYFQHSRERKKERYMVALRKLFARKVEIIKPHLIAIAKYND